MGRNNAPAALHHELHQKRSHRERHDAAAVKPQGNGGKTQKRSDHKHAASAKALRKSAEEKAAENRTDIGNHHNNADDMRRKPVINLEEGRIQILRAMAQKVERSHEKNRVNAKLPMLGKDMQNTPGSPSLHMPCRRFRDIPPNVKSEQCGKNTDHKQS